MAVISFIVSLPKIVTVLTKLISRLAPVQRGAVRIKSEKMLDTTILIILLRIYIE